MKKRKILLIIGTIILVVKFVKNGSGLCIQVSNPGPLRHLATVLATGP